VDNFSVSVQFKNSNGQHWWLTNVYGPQSNEDKISFLLELRQIRAECQGSWVVAGDFNLIYKEDDKKNVFCNRAMMGRFRKFIDDTSLIDLPLIGRKYTWSNHQVSPTLVRLDRDLCSSEWEVVFPNNLLQSAAFEDSDHCPLVLGL
jgi:endonuclease/exonuclease/phosphatase family metal-dependent hydrolase